MVLYTLALLSALAVTSLLPATNHQSWLGLVRDLVISLCIYGVPVVLNVTSKISSLWPRNVCMQVPLPTSHTLQVRSMEPREAQAT